MQILSLTVVVALSVAVVSFADENLAQNSNKLVGNLLPGFSELATSSAVKLVVSPDANTDTTNWVQNTFYLGSGCSGSVIMTTFISTGFCFPTSNPNVFYTYSCTSADITATRYSDASCTTVISTTTTEPPINYCFATDTDDDGYINADTGAWDSNQYTCATGYPQNTLPAAAVSRFVYSGTGCANSNMMTAQFGLQESCYTNYNGMNYTSFIFENPYRFNFNQADCNPANLLETIYLPLDSCTTSGGGSVSYSTYGSTTSSTDNSGDDGVSTDKLIVGIVVSFIGGVFLTVLGVFLWFKFSGKSTPLGSKADNVNNI